MIIKAPTYGDETDWMMEGYDHTVYHPNVTEQNPFRTSEVLGADGVPITIPIPRRAMGFDLRKRSSLAADKAEITLWDACRELTGYARDDLAGPRRFQPLAEARFKAYAIFRNAGYSLPQIGEAFNRDHTTVLHGLRRAEELQ